MLEKNQGYVLMLEADEDDRFITHSTLHELQVEVDIRFALTSTEFFELLKNHDKPFLILLNFNAKPQSALEILPIIKGDPSLSQIPVVVLGEMITENFIRECYRKGAASFVLKPGSVAGTRTKIKTFFEYWQKVVE